MVNRHFWQERHQGQVCEPCRSHKSFGRPFLTARKTSLFGFFRGMAAVKSCSEFDALKIWNKDCESAKVGDATPRDLRHNAITDMKRAGFNDAFVGNVAGHSDPRTTKRYTHFSVEETRMPLEPLVAKGGTYGE